MFGINRISIIKDQKVFPAIQIPLKPHFSVACPYETRVARPLLEQLSHQDKFMTLVPKMYTLKNALCPLPQLDVCVIRVLTCSQTFNVG